MATADEYAAWIVANQDKKDTPEFGTVAEAYKLAKAEINAPVSEQPKESASGGIGRQVGLAARYGIEGAAGIPGIFINPFQQAAGAKTMAQSTSDLLTKFGLPKEQTGAEQLSGAISRAMAGGGGMSALASRLPQLAGSVAPLIQSVLRQQPMAQVVQSGLGGGAAETVRQHGGEELAQFAAGVGIPLAAGIATSIATSGRQGGRQQAILTPEQ